MQRILLICCLLATVSLGSCGFYEHKERIELYKQIVATNDSLDKMTREWHMLLNSAVRTGDYSALHSSRVKLGQFISRRRSVIASLEVPSDAATLRESEGVFLSTQAAMISDVYPQFEAYTALTPDETVQKSLKLVSKDLETEMAWNLTIKKSLDAFVKKQKLKMPKK